MQILFPHFRYFHSPGHYYKGKLRLELRAFALQVLWCNSGVESWRVYIISGALKNCYMVE
jgi:hypothetical protein